MLESKLSAYGTINAIASVLVESSVVLVGNVVYHTPKRYMLVEEVLDTYVDIGSTF